MNQLPHEPVGQRHHFQLADSPRDPTSLIRLWVTPIRIYLVRIAMSGKLLQISEFRNDGGLPPAPFLQFVLESSPALGMPAMRRELVLTETPVAILPEAWVKDFTPIEAARLIISPQATVSNVIFFPEEDTDWGALLIQTHPWAETLDRYWPEYRIRHAAGLIWQSMQEVVSQFPRCLWVQVLEERVLLIAAREGSSLRLLNAYLCKDEADRPYYVQAVKETLGWEEGQVAILCAGELDQPPPPGWLRWDGLHASAPRSLLRAWPTALAHTPWWKFVCMLTNFHTSSHVKPTS